MSDSAENLTITFGENGIETTKELGKHILTKGSWTTILFRYVEWDEKKKDYGAVKYSIRRYQKRNNQYWMKSKFNISSNEQARKIIATLSTWLEEDEQASATSEPAS